MEINIELAKKIISKEYFINGDGGIRTQNPIYLNHLAFLMEKYHQEQLSIAAVSKSVNCDKCDGWGYTIDDIGSKTCDCQKENSSN